MLNNEQKAELVAVAHLVWYLTMLSAMPLVLFMKSANKYVLVLVIITYFTRAIWRGCPLRKWENNFRKKHDPNTVYDGTFFTHYIKKYLGLSISVWPARIIIEAYIIALLILSAANL